MVAATIETEERTIVVFDCPGCRYGHHVNVRIPEGSRDPLWQWNGSLESPTFTPSVFVNAQNLGGYPRCHSYVTDGKIQFLPDSTHHLAGQTVPLPQYD
ncbi:MAG: ammonia monooxygenase [Verrucomicrobia bacterium]|nr:ammonia monooxygenase [Verrucomicrobiota bacterium]